MKKLFFLSLISFIAVSCSDNKNSGADKQAGVLAIDSVKADFFPVTSFLKGQMVLFDSMQVTFLQINTAGGKSDSAWISKEKLIPLLQPFFADKIDKENLVDFFKESKFNDQTTASITFTYDPKTALPDSIALRHWDVYVNPETGTLKRIYILKRLEINEQIYTQQLTWQIDKWAKMVTILNKPDGTSEIQNEMKLLWDFTGVK